MAENIGRIAEHNVQIPRWYCPADGKRSFVLSTQDETSPTDAEIWDIVVAANPSLANPSTRLPIKPEADYGHEDPEPIWAKSLYACTQLSACKSISDLSAQEAAGTSWARPMVDFNAENPTTELDPSGLLNTETPEGLKEALEAWEYGGTNIVARELMPPVVRNRTDVSCGAHPVFVGRL